MHKNVKIIIKVIIIKRNKVAGNVGIQKWYYILVRDAQKIKIN